MIKIMYVSGLGFGFAGEKYEHNKVAILAAFFALEQKD